MNTFLDEITASLSKGSVKYENINTMSDFDMDIKNKWLTYGKLYTFCDLFNLTNLTHSETSLIKNLIKKKLIKSTIDWYLTKSFLKIDTTETGLSDYHKLIFAFIESKMPRLKPKLIFYRNYKKFDEESLLDNLQNKKLFHVF